MKKINKKITMIATAAIATASLASCSNELTETDFSNNNNVAAGKDGISLVKSPDVVAWSGAQTLGNTMTGVAAPTVGANAGDGYIGNQIWSNYDPETLENITDDERRAILEEIKKKVTGQKISEDLVFPWTAYFLQDVISGQNSSFSGAGSNGTTSASYIFEAFNKGADCSPYWHHGEDYTDYQEVTNSAHINSYYQKQNADGSQTRIEETALMYDMTVGTYDEMKGRQFRWFINCHENLHWSEYIIVEMNGSYYICFDFACGHPENDVDGNSGKGAEHNDWDYNDWILKITPAGNQPRVWTGESDNDDETADDNNEPSEVVPVYHNNEVEVNYAILDSHDYKIADLVTKLSIHVRYATNVDVKIPVPVKYLIESDDLYIFKEHFIEGDGNGAYGGFTSTDLEEFMENQNTSVSYDINGNLVTLYIEFKAGDSSLGDAFKDGYIRVYTTGINQDVIDACWDFNKDGINFEIYNYFQTEKAVWNEDEEFASVEEASDLNRETLFEAMNNSLIEFENEPEYYINAFGWNDDRNDIHPWHAYVKPMKGEGYAEAYRTHHLNSTPYNDIYVHERVDEADILHKHVVE